MEEKMNALRMSAKTVLRIAVALLLGLTLGASPAGAEIYQISSAGFVQRCLCPPDAWDDAEEFRGVLQPRSPNKRFFAPIDFPDGQRVCRFSLVYHDIN
jgi:hypothetical protein